MHQSRSFRGSMLTQLLVTIFNGDTGLRSSRVLYLRKNQMFWLSYMFSCVLLRMVCCYYVCFGLRKYKNCQK